MATKAGDSYRLESKPTMGDMKQVRSKQSNRSRQQKAPPSSLPIKLADAVLELNRELVAQNIWLREQLTADMIKDKNKTEDADEQLRIENERLKLQVRELENKLEKKKEVVLLSAKVVQSRISYRDHQEFAEYKLQLETDIRGRLFVWYRYSTFRKLAETLRTKKGYTRNSIPELPNKHIFGNLSYKIIQERVVKLNQFLETAISSDHLQWGIRIDADTCVYKRLKTTPDSPSVSLKTTDWALSSSRNDVYTDAVVISAKVVNSRIQKQVEIPFIEYQLRIESDVRGIVFVWYRYSDLYAWAERLKRGSSYHRIPRLRKEEPFGSLSKHIQHQTASIDVFLKKMVKLELFARIDGKIFVCELREKDAASIQNLEYRNPLAKLFSLKSSIRHQHRYSTALLYEQKVAKAN